MSQAEVSVALLSPVSRSAYIPRRGDVVRLVAPLTAHHACIATVEHLWIRQAAQRSSRPARGICNRVKG